ncbi:response regulator [Fodinibius halophilus]|uniref:Response regulator n=1 Tax=Fodinibius halophilus TaxID=1736908 RepID=A0A6M1SV12_9BACT|nr:response regulator [Fodinibius halophilus]NGP87416.1 response regulator [Fodinibius halophilus]
MSLNVLIVDDSAVMRKMITKTINLCGLDVSDYYEAGDGKEGLEKLDAHLVDLLFIDINMPVMDGMEMLSEVRKRECSQDLPVLIVSTESNEGRIEEIGRQGAAFIHKPFTPEVLREKIMGIIQNRTIS